MRLSPVGPKSVDEGHPCEYSWTHPRLAWGLEHIIKHILRSITEKIGEDIKSRTRRGRGSRVTGERTAGTVRCVSARVAAARYRDVVQHASTSNHHVSVRRKTNFIINLNVCLVYYPVDELLCIA